MQNNHDGVRGRGRPRKEGELKHASVRVRPSLHQQLIRAADQSGKSVAAELAARLENAFQETATTAPTRDLLNRIAAEINEIEAGAGRGDKNARWDKSLRTWAMVREVLANGPILEDIPHPDPAKVREIDEKHTELQRLQIEEQMIRNDLRAWDVHPSVAPGASFGEILANAVHGLETDDAHGTIDERDDLAANTKAFLHGKVDRLDEVQREIAKIRNNIIHAVEPYIVARRAARDFIYGANGLPNLPDWLTVPVGFEDMPPDRRAV